MHIFQMKFASVVKTGVLAVFTAGLLASCQKEGFNGGDKPLTNEITDPKLKAEVIEAAQDIPKIGIYNSTMDKVIVLDVSNPQAKTFQFVNPGPTAQFATNTGGSAVYFAEDDNLVILSEPTVGFGGAGGGGTVVAGNATLDIDFVFCFSVDTEEVLGGDLFGADGFGDVAGAIGFAGDFESLQEGEFDEDSDPFEFFEGLVYYFIYADELGNETYEVIEFFEAGGEDPEENEGFAFAWVVAFSGEDGGIYLSSDGGLTVNGGNIAFSGEYYCIEGVGFFEEEEDEEPDATIVSGFGEIGCAM